MVGPHRAAAVINILVVDDHNLVRQGFASLIAGRPGMKVVGEASDGGEAVRLAERLRPDVVLMDIAMPVMNGVEATREITKRLPRVRVLVLSTPSYADQLVPILRAGAAGYLLKDADATDLFAAIEAVHQGNSYFSPQVSTRMVRSLFETVQNRSEAAQQQITAREREILDLVAEGYANQEIARRMCVSVKTVEAHKTHIIAKLGLKNTLDLVKYAVRRQMTDLEAQGTPIVRLVVEMIEVTRLDGTRFFLNTELIESIESTPDTMIRLTTTKRLVVQEPARVVVASVLRCRRLQSNWQALRRRVVAR